MKVSAQLNNLRRSPRKVRLVADLLRGLDVENAQNQLNFLVKGSQQSFEKLLKSAIANAENNFGLDKNNLFIKDIIVNEGTKMKRWLPRAYGRATAILKRTSNIEIIIAEKIEGKGRKKIDKRHEIKDVKLDDVKKLEKKMKEEEEKEKKPARPDKRSVVEAEAAKEKEGTEFLEKKAELKSMPASKQGFLRKIFRRKSM